MATTKLPKPKPFETADDVIAWFMDLAERIGGDLPHPEDAGADIVNAGGRLFNNAEAAEWDERIAEAREVAGTDLCDIVLSLSAAWDRWHTKPAAKPAGWEVRFPADYDVPEIIREAVAAGLIEDNCSGNDSCPNFDAGPHDPNTDRRRYSLWCEHPDPAQRDSGNRRFRFWVCRADADQLTLIKQFNDPARFAKYIGTKK